MLPSNTDSSSDVQLTIKAAAEKLNVHMDTLRRWADRGQIHSMRHPVNNYRMFFEKDVMELKWKIQHRGDA